MSEPGFVRTVLGDRAPLDLGRINYHEHLFQATPLLPGDELTDPAASGHEAELLHTGGIDSMVDATPWGLGRRPETLARISATTGLQIIATTGFHREAHYRDRPELLTVGTAELTRICLNELQTGQPRTDSLGDDETERAPGPSPVRAGILKAGLDYWSISAFEHRVLEAVATAQRATGAPVMVHLEHGTCAHEVLDVLSTLGVPADRVILAHIDRSPDPLLYAELAERGAYLGCDGAARLKDWPESQLIAAIATAIEAGHGSRILLGGDVARRSRYRSYGGQPGMDYLTRRFVPRLSRVIGSGAANRLLTENPQRVLTWHPPTDTPPTEVARQLPEGHHDTR